MRSTLSICLVLAATAGDALAEVDRCAGADTDLAWRGTDLAEISGDTGWFPAGYVAQLRLTGRVVGHTIVETGVHTQACWHDGMQAQLAGRPGTGWLDVAYGAELSLRGRIHTSILGKQIDWEGEIPIPYLPTDLLLAGQTAFDPSLDPNAVARVSDGTLPITLLSTNALEGIIDIIGISGGLRVTVTPLMTTSYRTSGATLAGFAVDSPNDHVTISPGEAGFDGALDVPVEAAGLIRYEPQLRFDARFTVKILGYAVVDWQLLSVSMNLPALERPMTLTGEAARLALPELGGLGDGARMDFATGATQELRVRNGGEAPLALEFPSPPVGVSAAPLVIAPGDEAALRITADEAVFAAGASSLRVVTNDPDQPELVILLGKDVGGTDPGALPEDEADASGCSAGGSPGALGLVLVGVVGLVRRRRRA